MFKIIFLFIVLTNGELVAFGGDKSPTFESIETCREKVVELRQKQLSDVFLKNDKDVYMKAICVPVFGQRS